MSSDIFMINGEGKPVLMAQAPFSEENEFQELLARYPELLTNDQIDPSAPRRWIHIKREMIVPTNTEILSLDHLFLDQNGIPTLVEVKRAENLDLRRKVVAQMLDYAANAIQYWPPMLIRNQFEKGIISSGKDPIQEVITCLGIDSDNVDKFWELAGANLQSGKIRMLFVADFIPEELRRIVEFLNQQMKYAIVLALELRRFAGEGFVVLVPEVYRQTQRAIQEKKISGRSVGMSATEFSEKTKTLVNLDVANSMNSLFEFASSKPYTLRAQGKSLFIGCENKNNQIIEPFAFRLDGDGVIECQFGANPVKQLFGVQESMNQLRKKFEEIEGISLSSAPQYPTTSMKLLSPASIEGLRKLLEWVREKVESEEA